MSQPDRVDPVTPQEWQEAVDAAHACLLLDAARIYGLVEGGPVVMVKRCDWLLDKGAARGFTPSAEKLGQVIAAINSAVK